MVVMIRKEDAVEELVLCSDEEESVNDTLSTEADDDESECPEGIKARSRNSPLISQRRK